MDLLDRAVSLLSHRTRSELHPSLHYNSRIAKHFVKFPPLESCQYCAEWLTACGKNLYSNYLGIGCDTDVSLLAQLDYLTKCSKSRVLSKENKISLLSRLIKSSIQILKGFSGFSPPHANTVRLFEFLLRRLDEAKSKADASYPSSALPDCRFKPSKLGSSQKPTESALSRSNSVSPKPFQRSKTLADFNSISTNRRGTSLLPRRLVKSRSTIFNSVELSEQSLRLATTLLPPNVCYIIAYLTSALYNIQYCVGEDISTKDFSPLSSPDYLSSLMASILFPSDSEKTRPSSDTNWMETLLLALFSSSPSQNIHPPELLRDLVNLSNLPSPLKETEKHTETVKKEGAHSTSLHSSFARLEIEDPPPSSASGLARVEHIAETGRNTSKVTIDLVSELETRKGLMNLLNRILEDQALDPKTKYGYLVQFKRNHSEIFWKRFKNEYAADAYMARLERKIAETTKFHGSTNPPSILKAINKLSWSKANSKQSK
ncbi:hypothetical protein Aperf_G00000004634 [Anoplocephala perfoliata]